MATNRDGRFLLRLPFGCSVVVTPSLMTRIGRAQRHRRCVECQRPIPPAWPGVTCGSKACMGKWLPGKHEEAAEEAEEA